MKHLIVGTAGHIDHGKSSLVKALTGIDPDRLKEEKERGLTIDLGFAYLELEDGTRVSFVDVPGHERFVKNMLAGAAGMDIVILVVDATESIMPQTREHLDIMKLLEVSSGIIAITKVDMADNEMIEIVEAEVADLVQGSFLETAPVIRVSTKAGTGLNEIRRVIAEAVERQHQKDEQGLFRFPIDRVFIMKGFGTVVTGTVFSGWLGEDEPVEILPGGMSSRARQLQSHNLKQEKISAGMRAALNLPGIAVEDLKRGDTIVRPNTAAATIAFDAKIQLLPSAPRKLSRTSVVKIYSAASQQVARVILFGASELAPGRQGYAQVRCQKPICIFRRDRFVIRGESPELTIGGGSVLDIEPERTRIKKREKTAWLQKLEAASQAQAALTFLSRDEGAISVHDLSVRLGEPAEKVEELVDEHFKSGTIVSLDEGDGMLLVAGSSLEQLKTRTLNEMAGFFNSQAHRLFIPREQLRNSISSDLNPALFEKILTDLKSEGKITVSRDGIGLAGRSAGITDVQKSVKEKVEKIYCDSTYSPPTFSQVEELIGDAKLARQMTSLLIEEGTLRRISSAIAYHRELLETAIEKIRGHLQINDKLSVGDLKSILGISRKHAVPLLEYFDKIGLTTRVGDYRVLKEKARR